MWCNSFFLTDRTMQSQFSYNDEKFADIQMLRYRVDGFEQLSLRRKQLIYYLSQAALTGRDILWDQNGKYNLRIRKTLETIYTEYPLDLNNEDSQQFIIYLKRVWFSNGIHHHYGCEKFKPGFSEEFFHKALCQVNASHLPLQPGQTVEDLFDDLCTVIFDTTVMPKRVNQADGEALVETSACN